MGASPAEWLSAHRRPWSDKRAERSLGALACLVLLLIGGMVIFVFAKAMPSFTHNGLAWFGSGGSVDDQLGNIFNSKAGHFEYHLRAWPLVYGTALVAVGATLGALVIGVLSAIFIVEFAPGWLNRVLEPAVRLLAAVPSVVYGLIGVLVLVPYVGNHLISVKTQESVSYVVQLTGNSLLVAVLILTVMITPIMVAIVVDALRSVPASWREGAVALGVNQWRAIWTVSVRSVRPAIVGAAILATARGLGEAIMLSMVSGSVGFAPNPLDGLTFLVEPVRPLAATIVDNAEGLSKVPFGQTLYAFAAVLLVSAVGLSFVGWALRRRVSRFGLQAA